ncbi:DUF4139 domain-containing protein [Mucilaginibacter sp. McL0603]|uniref:DUF4139 domain-containing protein n=1 Tax=Mucilaginibacter sp. McL0603 TaxID=3415670 RepID=UPI003CF9D944
MFRKLLMAAVVFFITIAAKAEDQKIASKVQKVIVFLNGAQVTRTAMVNVSSGTSTLVFENISPGIDAQSIQVHADGEFTILSVEHEMNYFNAPGKQKQVEDLISQQKIIKDQIDLKNGYISIYEEEISTLRKNLTLSPQNVNLDVIKLKQALDFQTGKLTEIRKKEQDINNEVAVLNAELQKYNQQLNEINRNSGIATSNILVTVSSKTNLQSEFSLSYLVRNARWAPIYDIRAKNVNSPITISYKANVIQQSGEDWKNVKLTLSTGNPAVNSIKPELNPYYLTFAPTYAPSASLNEVVVVGYGIERKKDVDDENSDKQLNEPAITASTIPLSVNQKENQTNVEFNIDNPYSIPTDGKQYLVEIKSFDIDATYQYAVVPKISIDVFLTARIIDWNKYNFLSGQANIYFEGTYIGKSFINTSSMADTLGLSLGVDKSIVVTRKPAKEFTERRGLGSDKKETRDWKIEIKNRKNQLVNLLVEDQVPVSKNSSIDVETQELSGGQLDKETGKIEWSFSLKPQNDKKIELKYLVKYPKNQSLVVL